MLMAESIEQLRAWRGPPVSFICISGDILPRSVAQLQLEMSVELGPAAVLTAHRPLLRRDGPRKPPIFPSECSMHTHLAALADSDKLVFVHAQFELSPVAPLWVHTALDSSNPGSVSRILQLGSINGRPLRPGANAGPVVVESLSRVPQHAMLISSCSVSPSAFALSVGLWRKLEPVWREGLESVLDLCKSGVWHALHLNLGEKTTLAGRVGSRQTQLLPFWRGELDLLDLSAQSKSIVSLSTLEKEQGDGMSLGSAQLAAIMLRLSRSLEVPFVGLVMLNAAFLEMTLHWLCHVRGMQRVLERTVLVCTDAACLDALRSHPAAAAVGAIVGIPMDLRLHATRAHLGMRHSNSSFSQGLDWGTLDYHLLMLTRQLLLKDLIQARVPFLLFETDSWWRKNAYDYLDRVLASNGGLQHQEHAGLHFDVRKLNATAAPFDMLLYVDVPKPRKPNLIGVGGGFFLAVPTDTACRLFSRWTQAVLGSIRESSSYKNAGVNPTEQELLQQLLFEQAEGVRSMLLPLDLFPSGQLYETVSSASALRAMLTKSDAVAIQFNYIIGSEGKIERAKRFGQWGLNADGTCAPLL